MGARLGQGRKFAGTGSKQEAVSMHDRAQDDGLQTTYKKMEQQWIEVDRLKILGECAAECSTAADLFRIARPELVEGFGYQIVQKPTVEPRLIDKY